MVFINKNKIAQNFRISKEINAKEYLLNGKFVEWKGKFFDIYSPIYVLDSKGKEVSYKIGSYPMMDAKTALKILDSAVKAYDNGQGVWPKYSLEQRVECLEKFIINMKSVRDEVVKILMWEIAKNYSDAQKEFDRTVEYIEKTIQEVKRRSLNTNEFMLEENILGQVKKSPLGVVMCMGPYNYPLNESFATMIPAILMGNTALFKPPKMGILLHYPLLKAFANSFPKGVFNIVYGDGPEVIKPIMESGKVDVLAFIGSTKAANAIIKYHPKPNRLKLVLGLEAKNVGIILSDADIELAAKECVVGSLSFNGQRCTALKFIYVHEKIVKQFNTTFTKKVEELKLGLPFDNTFLTPIHNENLNYYNDLVNDAKKKGAKIINKTPKDNLTAFYPKVMYPITKEMRLYREEQFGPIVPIKSFKSINEVKEYVLTSNHGQQCAIFGKDTKIIGDLIDTFSTQVGRININAQCQRGPDVFPFSGRKDSAVGVLSIPDALDIFVIKTIVSFKLSKENKEIYKKILDKNTSQSLKSELLF